MIGGVTGFGQTGDYYVAHYNASGKADPSSNFDMVQHSNGVITFANRSGLLEFDGDNWELYSSVGTPISLAKDEEGIYAAGNFGVGYYFFSHPEEFNLLHEENIVKGVFQIQLIDGFLYAISRENLFIFSARDKKLIQRLSLRLNSFQKILHVNNQPLFITDKGSYWLKNDKFSYAEELPEENFTFAVNVGGYNLLGTSDGNLYKNAKGQWHLISLKKGQFEEQLTSTSFVNAVAITEEKLAISTVKEGVILIDPEAENVIRIIDQHNGLPDNEMYFISSDQQGGIWVGHSFGLSRIDTQMPLEVYNNFPGLKGNLQAVAQHNNQLYVGSSTGLYRLEGVKSYEEVIYYVEQKQEKEEKDMPSSEEQKSKGLFAFLKRKKNKEKEPEPIAEPENTDRIQKKIRKELVGIKHVYKELIDAKVIQLLPTTNELLVVTLNGLYTIKDKQVLQVSGKPVKFAWVDKNERLIIANTYNGELLSFTKEANAWEENFHFDGFQDYVLDIYQDYKGRVWFASNNEIYWVEFRNGEIFPGDQLSFDNSYLDPTFISENVKGEIVVKNNSGSWIFDEITHALVLKNSNPDIKKFIKTNLELWEYSGDQWTNSKGYKNQWLNIFDDIKHINLLDDSSILIVTSSNQLIKIRNEKKANKYYPFPIAIKSIKDNGEKIKDDQKLRFDQKQSKLSFEFVQPDFTNLVDIKYQYRIKGISNNWSEWSEENKSVYLPYLSEGSYELEIRSKNDFGQEQLLSSINFDIVPPYWQRPWFYAFEFSVLAVLLFITIHLNHNAPKYQLINKLLAFLTLIIIIEFIQASAEYNFSTDFSPVAAFFIQVIIAFIVFPVEEFLRKVIMKDKRISFKNYFPKRKDPKEILQK